MFAMDRLKVFVERVPHGVNVIVNQGLGHNGGIHETVVVSLLQGTVIFHLTEVDGMNPFQR